MILEDRKIGLLAVILGLISTLDAWFRIIHHQVGLREIIFLLVGLIATLLGIALLLKVLPPQHSHQKNEKSHHESVTLRDK